MNETGDGGRSKTNGPIKSLKEAAAYLLCVTGWRFTSLIRLSTYQPQVFGFATPPPSLSVSAAKESKRRQMTQPEKHTIEPNSVKLVCSLMTCAAL